MSFQDIKGQDRAINILKGYIEQRKLRGSYLFTGQEGIGKKLVAKTLAKAVNCKNGASDSCEKCAPCVKIEKNQHPDVHIIQEDNGQIKIDAIRQMQREINLRPYEARFKVFIIDNAHNLTAEAANSLLKILEEPPADTIIILITDKPALLFRTIISRCKILKFSSLPRMSLERILKQDYTLDSHAAHFLAYFSEGRIGRALKLKDTQILREKNRIIDNFSISRKPRLEGLSIQEKEDLRNCFNILATWFRDMYLVKIGMPFHEIINFDRKEELLSTMGKFSFLDLNDILNCISDSVLYLEQNLNTKLVLHNLGAHIWKG
jgi:DNA polymerase-3 subunit delta'